MNVSLVYKEFTQFRHFCMFPCIVKIITTPIDNVFNNAYTFKVSNIQTSNHPSMWDVSKTPTLHMAHHSCKVKEHSKVFLRMLWGHFENASNMHL